MIHPSEASGAHFLDAFMHPRYKVNRVIRAPAEPDYKRCHIHCPFAQDTMHSYAYNPATIESPIMPSKGKS